MNKKVKIGIGVAAAAAIGALLFKTVPKTIQLIESAGNIKVSLLSLPRIHTISPLKIAVALKVDNPAKGTVSLKIPSVRLYYNSKMIASTSVNDRTYTIEPVSTGKISGIMIEASTLSLLTTAPGIVSDFVAQGTNITKKFGFDVIAEVNGIPLKVQKL